MKLTQLLDETSDWFANTYYKVVKPVDVFHHVGWEPTNSYYGSARISQAKYTPGKLKAGDEIHSLAGGLFTVSKGKGTPGRIRKPSEKHPFEKSYGAQNPKELDHVELEKMVKAGQLEKLTKETKQHTTYKSSIE